MVRSRAFDSDIMLNYQLSQKLKLIRRGKFNHLTITLTKVICFSDAKRHMTL